MGRWCVSGVSRVCQGCANVVSMVCQMVGKGGEDGVSMVCPWCVKGFARGRVMGVSLVCNGGDKGVQRLGSGGGYGTL